MDYSALGVEVLDVLTEFGGPIEVSFEDPGEYDPDHGAQSRSQRVVLLGVRLSIDAKDVDGTTVQAGDLRVLLSVQGAPRPLRTGDMVMLDGAYWTVTNHQHVSPTGVPVCFDVRVRK